MELKIRQARKEDLNLLCQFIEIVDSDFFPPLSLRNKGIENRILECLLDKQSHYLIVEDHIDVATNRIVGVIGCTEHWKSKKDSYINLMCVHPLFRRKGIINKLYSNLEQNLKAKNITKIYVCTWSTNLAAINFYESHGFISYFIIKNDRGNYVDTIKYRKKLV